MGSKVFQVWFVLASCVSVRARTRLLRAPARAAVGVRGFAESAQRRRRNFDVGRRARALWLTTSLTRVARWSQFKLVLLGEQAAGKSSLVLRFVKGQFVEYQESTIGGASSSSSSSSLSSLLFSCARSDR